ncbi:hypothetical protein HYG81_21160 (plasmid) [Natrinema zhouii]|uniref:hypothetical protein n=1 Tax=Natrinema zhouii TaxID=1710539 RepID=UPI001D0013CC|nr:hypothetical protein [Natrinema zhouii]UHQ98100.1 hypothetical protein HYG81_21160 [Natrinema zhouii]
MSNCYVIGYDLQDPGQNYDDLTDAIEDYGTWWGHLDSTYIVKTSVSASDIRDNLHEYLDPNDKLLVAKLSGAWAGSNLGDAADWLYDQMQSERLP